MRDLNNNVFSEADIVKVKALHKYPIPTALEFRGLLDHIPNYHPFKIALGLIGIEAMRPSEVVNLTWNNIEIEGSEVKRIKHLVYKPRNRITHKARRTFYKEVSKPMFSEWLSHQIIGYLNKYGPYPYNKVFPWTTADALGKLFTLARKNWSEDLPFLKDQNVYIIKGQDKARYRIHPYSFRRFAFTFHYYNTFNRDVVTLSRSFGHSKTETTLDYYVFPAEAIGLSVEADNIQPPIDVLLGFQEIDSKLTDYMRDMRPEVEALRVNGQRRLQDFILAG